MLSQLRAAATECCLDDVASLNAGYTLNCRTGSGSDLADSMASMEFIDLDRFNIAATIAF